MQSQFVYAYLQVADLRNETSIPVFYGGNKIWVRIRVRMN